MAADEWARGLASALEVGKTPERAGAKDLKNTVVPKTFLDENTLLFMPVHSDIPDYDRLANGIPVEGIKNCRPVKLSTEPTMSKGA